MSARRGTPAPAAAERPSLSTGSLPVTESSTAPGLGLGVLITASLLIFLLIGCGAPSSSSRAGAYPRIDSSDPDRVPPPPIRTAAASPEHGAAIDSARAVLQAAAEEGVGVAVAVVVDEELVWLEGAGYANRDDRAPVDPENTRFRIYSVTKPMTAVAAARLMERGRLDPSVPVQRYVPDFPDHPEHPDPITPMRLATHTSGIRHYADDAEANNQRHCETVEEAVSIFRDDPLVHPPGQEETYSSWGYVLLSAVLEGANGSTYPAAMEEWVFEPTGMSHTVVDDPTEAVDGRAIFYEGGGGEPGRIGPAEPVDNTCKWGAGAYLSTADDVARFGAAMLDPGFLSAPSLELFMRGGDVYQAQGVGAGGAAFLAVDRSASLSTALLSNAIGERSGPAAQKAAARIHALFGEAP